MIEQLLPSGVAHAEAFADVPESTMYPEEAELVGRAVLKRRREFATVRHCARQALAQLGVAPVPLLRGERGAPQWPAGVVGSMTHCDGYRAAAVARSGLLHSIGLDAEPHAPLPDGVLAMIARPEELTRVAALSGDVCGDRLLFCAKEAIYKAWFPLARRWLDFAEASVTLDRGGSFTAELLVDGPVVAGERLTGFTGRWLVADGYAVAAVTVPVD